jgi:2-iminobutanoate/2-iminopropanoate deaminase
MTIIRDTGATAAEQEMMALGVIDARGTPVASDAEDGEPLQGKAGLRRISADSVLNEAYDYLKPSAFSRAVAFDIADTNILLVSGTASVGSQGETVHAGDFDAQLWRTYRNITELLGRDGMTWHHVVLTHNYLRDIERDYEAFNRIRTRFYAWLGLDPLPASLGIQAILCRPELLVEISAVAIRRRR